MAKKYYTISLKNAEASVRMEGYSITPKMRQQCAQVLSGKTTTDECLKQFVISKTSKAVK
ncbi:MAG: antitoxin VbhA family protein [Clostridiales bacterium]|nr:antitoxin VbhA family protein [Clostridiales bacterium]